MIVRNAPRFAITLCLTLAACKDKGKGSSVPGQGGAQPSSSAVVASATQKQLVDLANEDLAKGRWVSAMKRADETLATNPRNADAHTVRAAALWRAGDFTGSTDAYRKALQSEPKHFGASLGIARNLQAIGQHTEAIQHMDALIAQDPKQLDPLLMKFWSLYTLLDVGTAELLLEKLFQVVATDDPQLPIVQAYATFVRALVKQGKLVDIVGNTGKSDAQLDMNLGLKHSGANVGGQFARVVFQEMQEEAHIDKGLVAKLKLKEIAKLKPAGGTEEVGVVMIPEVKFGELTIKNVPALAHSLEHLAAIGETPGIVLGRQVLYRLGTITFDFPTMSLELAVQSPSKPADATELAFILLDMHVLHAPAVLARIDGSEHAFWAWFGGIYRAGVTATKKTYLKSGHRPGETEPPDDPQQGLKMVYVDRLTLGDLDVRGVGGLVLTNTPPDPTLDQFRELTGFELGGFINLTLVRNWNVTYSLAQGKVYIAKPV